MYQQRRMSVQKFHCPVSNGAVALRRVGALSLGPVLVTALSGIVVPSTAEAQGAWGISTTQNEPGANSNSLGNVSCVSTTFCMAIGAYSGQNGESETLAESWNGTAWSVVTTPIQSINRLSNLTCVSDVLCTAVGSYQLS